MDPDPDFRPIRIRTQENKFVPNPEKTRIRNTVVNSKAGHGILNQDEKERVNDGPFLPDYL